MRRLLEERYGGTAPYQLGLQVHTAVDLSLQRAAEEALQEGLRELDQRQGFRGPIRHLEPDQVDAFLAQEAAARPLDAGRARAVVLDVRPQGLTVRTGWERGVLPASALELGHDPVEHHLEPTADAEVRLGDRDAQGQAPGRRPTTA